MADMRILDTEGVRAPGLPRKVILTLRCPRGAVEHVVDILVG